MNAPSYKRSKSFWEPIYAPEEFGKNFPAFDWNTRTVTALRNSTCRSEELVKVVNGRPRHTIKSTSFTNCDFQGHFDFTKFTFDKCSFKSCDFMDTKWLDAKFTNCIFDSTSLSTAAFSNCQFIECKWLRLGISSNEMHFEKCRISNPYEFVASAYTNLDPNVLKQKNKTLQHQKYRLEGTKAKVARMLLINLQGQGDDDPFYDAVKAYTTQTLIAKIAAKKFQAWSEPGAWLKVTSYAVRILLFVELAALSASGRINGWGGNVGRALLFGPILISFFWGIYFLSAAVPGAWQAGIAALEITLLIGYTKYTSTSTPLLHQMLFALNMVLGLWWYAIFVPTMLNRINRTN
jgi:hypothetical protein